MRIWVVITPEEETNYLAIRGQSPFPVVMPDGEEVDLSITWMIRKGGDVILFFTLSFLLDPNHWKVIGVVCLGMSMYSVAVILNCGNMVRTSQSTKVVTTQACDGESMVDLIQLVSPRGYPKWCQRLKIIVQEA